MTTTSIVVLVLVLVALAAIAFYLREQRSKRLRSRFGTEYDRVLREYGSRTKAEEALAHRQRRVEKIHLRTLAPQEQDQFLALWRDAQARFVDDPSGAVREADRLVSEVMVARGYPMSNFEHRVQDLSVVYPQVLRNYRSAHEIALLDEKGQASTEDRRRAMVFYRDLFDELIEAPALGAKEVRR